MTDAGLSQSAPSSSHGITVRDQTDGQANALIWASRRASKEQNQEGGNPMQKRQGRRLARLKGGEECLLSSRTAPPNGRSLLGRSRAENYRCFEFPLRGELRRGCWAISDFALKAFFFRLFPPPACFLEPISPFFRSPVFLSGSSTSPDHYLVPHQSVSDQPCG